MIITKNKIFLNALFIISLIPANLFAQELNEEFLEGLPESVREGIEVQNEMAQDNELEQLFRSETSVTKNKVILKKIESELQSLKAMMNPEEMAAKDKPLDRFGNAFFSSIQSSFMPINVPNQTEVWSTYVALIRAAKTDERNIRLLYIRGFKSLQKGNYAKKFGYAWLNWEKTNGSL